MFFKKFLLVYLILGFQLAQSQTFSVFFATDKSELQLEATRLLDSLVAAEAFWATDSLLITCHCDVRADSAYNQALSLRRAQSVQLYLRQANVKSGMRIIGFGEANPVAPNTEAQRYKNRRCDITLKKPPIVHPEHIPEPTVNSVEDWETGTVIALKGLEFVGNQALPLYYSMPELYALYTSLAAHRDVEIELHGHVCCGDDRPLSISRAKAVHDFLVDNGIAPARLAYQGFSNSRPLVEEVDAETQQRNRRVEVYVTRPPSQKPVMVPTKPLTFSVQLLSIEWDKRQNQPVYEGGYNLDLVAKMLAKSRGYTYELFVYATKTNQVQARIAYLKDFFARRRVSVNKLRITEGKKAEFLNRDILILEVKANR